MGTNFWGCMDQKATPDIMTMAKSICNGLPFGAVVTTKEIASAIHKKAYFNTFGGGPIQCRVALEVLRIIE